MKRQMVTLGLAQKISAFFAIVFCCTFLLGTGLAFAADKIEIPFPNGAVNLINPIAGTGTVGVDRPLDSEGQVVIAESLLLVTKVIKYLVGTLAIAWIVWESVLLVTSQGEQDKMNTAKRGITWSVLALIGMLMIDTVILDVFYGGRNGIAVAGVMEDPNTMNTAIDEGTRQLLGLLEWAKGITIMIAVAFLMVSGFRMLTSLGNTEDVSKQKSVFLWIGVGVVVLMINEVLIQGVLYPRVLGDDFHVTYTPNAETGVNEIIGIMKYFLGFLALIAFLVFVYGGGMWVLSFGEEDRVQSGKKILTGAAIGIIIILMSYVVTSTFSGGQIPGIG